MILFVNRNWYYRLLFGAMAGLLTWLLAEVGFNIRYRYFELFANPLNYMYAGILGAIVHESLFRSAGLLEKKHPWESNPGRRLLVQSLAGAGVAIFWVMAVRFMINFMLAPGKLIILTDELMILALVIFFILVLNLVELGTVINERYHKSLAEIERFRKENAEYQFEMLKLQLNPHFLFNSLNTLSSLVHEDQAKSAEFIRRLSDVYRYVLENRNKELVSLREEMEFIRSYAFLQSLRFQGMIEFRFEVGEPMLDRKIAPMTLQLLLENAVKHNVASRKMPLSVAISAREDEIMVTNNLQPKDQQNSTGVGLKNITSRYDFLTGRKVSINRDDHQFSVIIPLI